MGLPKKSHIDFVNGIADIQPDITIIGEYLNCRDKILVKAEQREQQIELLENDQEALLAGIASILDQKYIRVSSLKRDIQNLIKQYK